MRKLGILAALMLGLMACKKETTDHIPLGQEGVYLLNEGNFNWGNASVSFYNASNGQWIEDLFFQTNQYKAGDVAQSMALDADTVYLVMNNSGKMIKCLLPDLKVLKEISIPSSPRYMAMSESGMALISDLYGNKLHVYNRAEGRIVGEIPVSGWTEQMVYHEGVFYVCMQTTPFQTGANYAILTIPSGSFIPTAHALLQIPKGIIRTNQQKVLALCAADPSMNREALLLECSSSGLDTFYRFSMDARPSAIAYDAQADRLLFAEPNQLLRMNATQQWDTLALPSGYNLYGMGVNPKDGTVWLSNAQDYVRPSSISVYDSELQWIKTFSAGVLTNQFLFR